MVRLLWCKKVSRPRKRINRHHQHEMWSNCPVQPDLIIIPTPFLSFPFLSHVSLCRLVVFSSALFRLTVLCQSRPGSNLEREQTRSDPDQPDATPHPTNPHRPSRPCLTIVVTIAHHAVSIHHHPRRHPPRRPPISEAVQAAALAAEVKPTNIRPDQNDDRQARNECAASDLPKRDDRWRGW